MHSCPQPGNLRNQNGIARRIALLNSVNNLLMVAEYTKKKALEEIQGPFII